MRRWTIPCVMVATSIYLASLPNARADGKSETCAQAFDQCLSECDTKHPGDTAGRAACVPSCSAKYAACDAGVAYDKAKPWIEEQAKKTKKFFDDLMKDLKKDEPPSSPGKSI